MARRAPTRSKQRKEAEELLGLRLCGLFEVLSHYRELKALREELRARLLAEPPAVFAAFIRREIDTFGKFVREAGLKFD